MTKKKRCMIVAASLTLITAITGACTAFATRRLNRYSKGVLPTAEMLESAPHYERVVIFGIDGAGGFFGECDTPEFDRVFSNGSVTYTGMSQLPTTSAHNWTSMLHGVRYQKHRINNTKADTTPYTDTKYPSVFMLLREQYPNADMASIVNWASINIGIIEDDIGVAKQNVADYIDENSDTKKDEKVKELVLQYLDTNDPKLLFMQFDEVDHMGHAHGYASAEFERELQTIDGYLGEIYDKYVEKGWGENTLFIAVSDHGHKARGGHGNNSFSERNVTLAVWGGQGNVIKGSPDYFVTQDIASIVLYALGISQPESYEARIPTNMFEGVE